jgi:hypothetical protein
VHVQVFLAVPVWKVFVLLTGEFSDLVSGSSMYDETQQYVSCRPFAKKKSNEQIRFWVVSFWCFLKTQKSVRNFSLILKNRHPGEPLFFFSNTTTDHIYEIRSWIQGSTRDAGSIFPD